MTKAQLRTIIASNLQRVDRIFNAVDFGQVCLTSQLVTDMNEFFRQSKEAINSG